MILIISNKLDQSTIVICLWLSKLKKKFKILLPEDTLELKYINGNNCVLYNHTRDYELDLLNVKTLLYRQGFFPDISNLKVQYENDHLSNFCKNENFNVLNFILSKLNKINHYGHPSFANLNKLTVLENAKAVKLNIPEFIYTSEKSVLEKFMNKKGKVIVKTIQPSASFFAGRRYFGGFTEILSEDRFNKLGQNFYPTFFQELIQKKFDIRTFYLDNNFYSIAVASQKNEKTAVDFRIYDGENPNRRVPFKLDTDTEKKILRLIKLFNLKYCSIDWIYGQDKKMYFLEINPIGQFGFVSNAGNYLLEKKLATLL